MTDDGRPGKVYHVDIREGHDKYPVTLDEGDKVMIDPRALTIVGLIN